MTKDNNNLGKFELTGIPPAPRGVPQIEVSFELDANGILKVTAGDKGTGKSESITITNEKGRLSQEEIDRMVAEAEKFAEEDKATREKIEARNGLENYAFSLKNQVNDEEGLGGKIEEDDKESVRVHLSCCGVPSPYSRLTVRNSSSRPSRKPWTGSTRTRARPRRRTSQSRRRSSATWRIQSRASSTPEPAPAARATTTSRRSRTSCEGSFVREEKYKKDDCSGCFFLCCRSIGLFSFSVSRSLYIPSRLFMSLSA